MNFVIESAPRTRPPLLPFIILISATFLTVASAAGFATWQTSQPVKDLAVSSQRLGLGETHVPVKVSGPYDVRKAIRKFNTMGKRLETTLASQRDVLVAIGHDLRTPLTSLRVRVASLQDSEEQGNMNRALDELERLMDAALEIGKKELPKTPRERIDAGALIHSLSEDLRTIGVDVDFIEPEELIVVDGWTIELTRALRNLIENAVRYGTKAKVQIRPTNSAIQFIVQDNGPGIPPDQLERVFEPLYRVERSRSTDTGGHGLGLSIAMKIARTHNGDILLENMSGGGLQATLIIPKSGAE